MSCGELKKIFQGELKRLKYYKQFRLLAKEYTTKAGINLYYSVISNVNGEVHKKYIGRRNKIVDMISARKYLEKSVKLLESGASVRDVDPNYLRHQLSKPYQTLPKFIYDLAGVISFEEWIDVFTKKRQDYNLEEFNGLQNSLEKVAKEYKDDDEYFTRFVFYLFNYQNWFYNKKGRERK